MQLHDDLSWRGLIFQESDTNGIRTFLNEGPKRVYAGFDPTADSLHVGSLVPLLALRRYQRAGHQPIILLGGGTGLIGDPSGKSTERNLNTREVVLGWLERFREQISSIIDLSEGPAAAIIVDNYEWIHQLSAIEYLRDIGKHFPISAMMAKESVQNRLEREGGGISYTEFSYMILQAFDFYHLAKDHGCLMQIGGSDQWGNMTAGIELIRRKLSQRAYIQTLPLITSADGKKFGKSEGTAIWLDPDKTSPYGFYQYWLNVDDQDAIRFLKLFTFVPREEIEDLAVALADHPEQRSPHHRLATEMTELIHGKSELEKVRKATAALFGRGDLADTDLKTLLAAVSSAPTTGYQDLDGMADLPQLMVSAGLVRSKSEARKTIKSGGFYLNNSRVKDPEYTVQASDLLHNQLLLMRRGKKAYAIARLTR